MKEIFDRVQQMLAANRRKALGSASAKAPCMLGGVVFDDAGNIMTPKHSRAHKRYYRYYTSQAIILRQPEKAGSLANVPAHELESVVKEEISAFLNDSSQFHSLIQDCSVDEQARLIKAASEWNATEESERFFCRSIIARVDVSDRSVTLTLCADALLETLRGTSYARPKNPKRPIYLKREVKLAAVYRGSKVIIGSTTGKINHTLVRAITRSHLWHQKLVNGEVDSLQEICDQQNNHSRNYASKIFYLRFLAPDITEAILNGEGLAHLTLGKLSKISRILDWADQRKAARL